MEGIEANRMPAPIKLKATAKALHVSPYATEAHFALLVGMWTGAAFLWSSVTRCVRSFNKCSHTADLAVPLPGTYAWEIIRYVGRDLWKYVIFNLTQPQVANRRGKLHRGGMVSNHLKVCFQRAWSAIWEVFSIHTKVLKTRRKYANCSQWSL